MRGQRRYVGILAAAAVALAAATAGPAAAGPRAAPRTPGAPLLNSCPTPATTVLREAPGRGRTVALTFDDGPGLSTAAILTLLQNAGVPATFFNVGVHVGSHRHLLRREVRLGEAVGNHTWDHADMSTLDAATQAREVDRTQTVIERLGDIRPCLFRPPFGNYDATTLRIATSRDLGVWLWSVDTEDWKAQGSSSTYWVRRIAERARAGLAQPHPVILFHNGTAGNPATVAALPQVIRSYRSAGYRFVLLR